MISFSYETPNELPFPTTDPRQKLDAEDEDAGDGWFR